ncbi:hypothetical protein JCM2811A_26850 [Methylorubrum rhodinum]
MCREWPSTSENSQTIQSESGASVKVTTKRAKSTWACWPAGVSKRTSYGLASAGRIAATNRFTAV